MYITKKKRFSVHLYQSEAKKSVLIISGMIGFERAQFYLFISML